MFDKRRKEIYSEMDSYISFLRKNEAEDSRFSIFGKRKKEKIEPKPEFSEVMEEVKEIKEAKSETENIPEELRQELGDEEEKKIGFLSFVTNLFKRKEEEDSLEEENFTKIELYKTQMEDDTRKALQIADEMMGKIPNFELRKFMQSKDYEVYENVMKKYGLK